MTPEEAASKMREAAMAVAKASRFGDDIPESIDRMEAVRASAELCHFVGEAIRALPLPPDPPAAVPSTQGETPETDAETAGASSFVTDSDRRAYDAADYECLVDFARSLERRLREAEQRIKTLEEDLRVSRTLESALTALAEKAEENYRFMVERAEIAESQVTGLIVANREISLSNVELTGEKVRAEAEARELRRVLKRWESNCERKGASCSDFAVVKNTKEGKDG